MRTVMDKLLKINSFTIFILVTILGIIMQFSGRWITMLAVGFIGGLLINRFSSAFIIGFLCVATAWSVHFTYLIFNAQALLVANFLTAAFDISGYGWAVILLAIIIGGLLGGLGALLGHSVKYSMK